MSDQTIHIHVEKISKLLQNTFELLGSSSEKAERITRRLIGANLRGHESHGVIRMPRYVEGVLGSDQYEDFLEERRPLADS